MNKRTVTNALLSPLFPLPSLYRVQGGWVPNEPTAQDEPKPVLQLVGFELRVREERKHWFADLIIPRPIAVRVWVQWQGPSYTGRGTVDRVVVRVRRLTRMPKVPAGDPSIPRFPPILALLPPHVAQVWERVGENTRWPARVVARFPSWVVLFIPTELFYEAVGVNPQHIPAATIADETVRRLL